MTLPLPEGLLDLLRRPSPCFLATVMPDGSPQLTQTWVTTDGEHIVINTGVDRQKSRNIARDPRVAVTVADPDDASRYYGVRGRVVARRPRAPPTASTRSPSSTSAALTRTSGVGPRRGSC